MPENRKHLIIECIPAAAIVYFFGFLIIFSLSINGLLAIVVFSLTSAILLSGFVISMSMPELKRKPPGDGRDCGKEPFPDEN
jgi:anaerobic C4-dicarboxylate transporter